jgi:hypothetical protein
MAVALCPPPGRCGSHLRSLAAGNTIVMDSNIGPRQAYVGTAALRHLNPDLMIASFLDQTVSLDELVAAARTLRRRMRGVTYMLDTHLSLKRRRVSRRVP